MILRYLFAGLQQQCHRNQYHHLVCEPLSSYISREVTISSGRGYARSICSIFFLCMESCLGYVFKQKCCLKIFACLIWFGWVLWHINHYRLFNAKSSLYKYIKYIGFGLVGFYGILTLVGYLMPNPLYTNILNIYDLVWLGWVLWHISHRWLFNAKSSLYTYIKDI